MGNKVKFTDYSNIRRQGNLYEFVVSTVTFKQFENEEYVQFEDGEQIEFDG
jgi:hypothetical protein